MKTLLLLVATVAFAQQGILPGEPDPNKSPRTDHPAEANKKCKEGMKAIPQMECVDPKHPVKLSCSHPVAVTNCGKRPMITMCKKPLKPVAAMKCE